MSYLKKRLLATIEVHGKSDISGIYNLYPHERRFSILRSLLILKNEGWIKIRKSRTVDGFDIPQVNVQRTKKQRYAQLSFI